jgi:hypothetical protein
VHIPLACTEKPRTKTGVGESCNRWLHGDAFLDAGFADNVANDCGFPSHQVEFLAQCLVSRASNKSFTVFQGGYDRLYIRMNAVCWAFV